MPRKEYDTLETRKPQIELGSLEQDALRRDFSANPDKCNNSLQCTGLKYAKILQGEYT